MLSSLGKSILNLVCGCCVVGSLGTHDALAQDLKPEVIYQRILPSVMTLRVENAAGEEFIGSAFLAMDENVAVTAWHVLRDARRVVAHFADGGSFEVKGYIDKDETRDLALIRVEVPDRPRAPLSREIPMVGSRAYVIGSPKGYEFSIGDGLISQIQLVDGVRQYQISCPISAGNSGGPIVNERGEVVGVTSWSKLDAQNLNFAIPSRAVFGMDASQPATRWGQPIQRSGDQTGPGELEPEASANARAVSPVRFPSLRDLLRDSAGREITVTITEQGKPTEYRFTVPNGLVK